ncbi:hypothetical protein [Nibricoccus sp. IMCC34717]|uniref:hypothetical protein n=1 Tax=Nibricoccus sp. IMCC34717 TaxID=3034021 RepID=UPI00384DF952
MNAARVALLFVLLAGPRLAAQMIVSDPGLTSVAYQHSSQLAQLQGLLQQANRELALLVRYTGNPATGMARVDDLSSFVTNVGRMGQPRYRADVAAEKVRVREAMAKSENPYRRRVGTQVTVAGKAQKRNEKLYEDELRFEGSVQVARELLEVNRQHQHTLLGRLSTANDHYERADTQSELMAAAGEMQRLQALIAGADALAANLTRDLGLVETQRRIGAEDARRRRLEADRMAATLFQERMADLRQRLDKTHRQQLSASPEPEADYEKTLPWVGTKTKP